MRIKLILETRQDGVLTELDADAFWTLTTALGLNPTRDPGGCTCFAGHGDERNLTATALSHETEPLNGGAGSGNGGTATAVRSPRRVSLEVRTCNACREFVRNYFGAVGASPETKSSVEENLLLRGRMARYNAVFLLSNTNVGIYEIRVKKDDLSDVYRAAETLVAAARRLQMGRVRGLLHRKERARLRALRGIDLGFHSVVNVYEDERETRVAVGVVAPGGPRLVRAVKRLWADRNPEAGLVVFSILLITTLWATTNDATQWGGVHPAAPLASLLATNVGLLLVKLLRRIPVIDWRPVA
jgi:hypothetical protein